MADHLGDGTGYDTLSFEENAVARFIDEVEFLEETEAFCLYRVFDFSRSPQLFILRGPLTASVQLEALDYRARLRAITR